MNTLLVNLDFYDDSGSLLRELVPNPEDIPSFVKTAHVMTGSEDSDLYALVLQDDSGFHKKFPTYDQGNTWVSSSYFAENHHKLPEEAQKVAAANLKTACDAFNIPVLEVIEKLASDTHTRIVKVTDHTPTLQKVASSTEYALDGKYPINSAAEIKAASDYFSHYVSRFEPEDRRTYAVKVASAAKEYNLPVSDEIQMYSGTKMNENISEHLSYRVNLLNMEPEDYSEATWTLDKLAEVAHSLEPDVLASALTKFDRKHGLDRYWGKDILDPYTSALIKEASGLPVAAEVIKVGPLTVAITDLKNLAKHRQLLINQFGEGFAMEFSNDPVGIFESMPTPQKRILINMANSQVSY